MLLIFKHIFLYFLSNLGIIYGADQDTTLSWHLLNTIFSQYIPNKLGEHTSQELERYRKRWNISVNLDSKSYKGLYFEKAFDIIYKHQNPVLNRNS